MTDDPQPDLEDTDALKRALVEMSAGGGALPPERQLASDLGVPRSRLRRILAELRDEGELPPTRPGRRSVRRETNGLESLVRVANPTDVIELRILLEPNLARLAAIRASSVDIARIMRATSTRPDEGYGAADLAFHMEVARGSRNALGAELYRLLREVGRDSRVRLPANQPVCPARQDMRDQEHMVIARAIAARDPDQAEAAMAAHLGNVRRLIQDRLTPDLIDDGALSRASGLNR